MSTRLLFLLHLFVVLVLLLVLLADYFVLHVLPVEADLFSRVTLLRADVAEVLAVSHVSQHARLLPAFEHQAFDIEAEVSSTLVQIELRSGPIGCTDGRKTLPGIFPRSLEPAGPLSS